MRALALLALLWLASPATSEGADAMVWQGRFEMGDATILLQIEVAEPGEASAWLTGFDGVRRPTAIEAFAAGADEVTFRLPEVGRGYSFTGRLVSPSRIEGTLERLPPQAPATDLHAVQIAVDATGGWKLGIPRNLTDRPGYDNQPRFLSNGRSLLYTSMRDDQTDIYRYDLDSDTTHQITDTPESEYSPTPLPGGGGFSTVRVEQDGVQRLWAFDLDGTKPRLLLPEIEPVGYHAWIDETTVALFVLGEPPTLRLARLETGESEQVADDPGRALQPLDGGRVLFVDKTAQDTWWLAEAGPGRGVERWSIETLPEREDFLWVEAAGQVLMAQGSKLFAAVRPDRDNTGDLPEGSVPEEWQQIADFSPVGIGDVSRLSLAPDGSTLVFVAGRPDLSPFPEQLALTLLAAGTDN